ncbi:hypothetical protein [Halobacterium rubrum]|uniref:hypothetical protein n=1 Tax=Halobacterium TaxID=2239 RepID=UPI001F3C3E5F|nr:MULTISPECIES: hypothetical protein [Halobacterium]MDH5019291.1 hypothetical protein [Halobacterium rubrum]
MADDRRDGSDTDAAAGDDEHAGGRDGTTGAGDDASGDFSFSLPPIRLPPLFPERFRVLWPGGGSGPSTRPSRPAAIAGLVAFDLADAALAVWATDAAVVAGARVLAGSLVAGVAFGLPGALYALEAAAVLGGAGLLTVFPTLSALLLVVRVVR